MNQQTLRKKLQSTKNIQHIAEAIELVSGVKFKKLMGKMEHFRFYADKLSEMVENLASASDGTSHPYFLPHKGNKKAVIILSSDKGLSGAYNANLFRKTDRFLQEQAPETELIIFGQKAQDHYKRRSWKIRESHTQYVQHLNEEQIKSWSFDWSSAFLKEEFDELWVAYTHFKNVLLKEPRVEQILPLAKKTREKVVINYIFEPDPEILYENIIPYFFYTKVQALMLETQASELSSRILSMKAATKNAEELIKKLTLIKNKVRQFGITREILEINAGAQEFA